MTATTDGTSYPINQKLQLATEEFAKWWTLRSQELDAASAVREPVFHYTDMRGLAGILESQKIWFTSIFHLNDPSELAHGIGLAMECLSVEIERGDPPVKKFCRWVQHVLVKSGGEIFGFFIASFSRADNDLGQWRAYADNGRGVALGLAPRLFNIADKQDALGITEKTIAARVSYDPKETQENMSDAIRRATAAIAAENAHVDSALEAEAFGRRMAEHLVAAIFTYALTCKHPAYANEQETRLLLANDLENLDPFTEVRTRGSALVPYIKSPMLVRAPGAITKITIGPAADTMADDAVRSLLRKYGLPASLVEKSDIPYTAH